jgi:transcriptional regulator with XRE-family HTH domain
MHFGNNVRTLREARGLTTQQLGDLVGMQQGNLSKIENGRTWIGRTKLIALAEALNVPVAFLFREDANEEIPKENAIVASGTGTRKLPVWDYSTAASFVYSSPTRKAIRDLSQDQAYVLTDKDYSKESFGIKVPDDAMAPILTPGMLAIVDPERAAKPNSIVAFLLPNAVEGDTVILRFFHDRGHDSEGNQKFEAVPRNRAFRTFSSEIDKISIVGGVTEHRQYW